MQKYNIDFSQAGFSPLITDYLARDPFLRKFYCYEPSEAGVVEALNDRKNRTYDRKRLVDVLHRQNSRLENDSVNRNIDLLLDRNTFTVTTGHQLNIFTGPLYFAYKILTAVKLAEQLKESHPHCNFVPVYWMASEDHDFEEISSIHLFEKKLEWENPNPGLSVPSGQIATASLAGVIKELAVLMGVAENAAHLLSVFEESYTRHQNLGMATRSLVNTLFGKYGLLVLDADCRELKELFRPVIRQDLFENASYRLVSEAVSRLGQKYKVQVHPREINLFYMKDAHRERIVKTGEDEYQVLNTGIRFSRTEIEQEIEAWPERFSPNVVLRPLYQEQALPNIAMVGGPAEIAYWMEYKDMFEHYRIGFPLLILRNCFMWLDRKTYGKMEKMGVSPQDVFSETDTLIRRHLLRDGGVDLTEEKEELRSIFDRILKKAEAIDITLRASVEAERTRQLKRLGHQEDKLLRARKRKSEFTVKQLRDIRERLFPGGNLQERYDNFIPYFLNYGDSFFDMLKEQINPFSAHFQVLVPEE